MKEVARVGEGEEGGLVGSAEPGDPNLAGGPVLPMKLRVCRSGICLLSLCNSFYSLCCSLWPPKVVPLDHNDGQFFRAMEWLMFFF